MKEEEKEFELVFELRRDLMRGKQFPVPGLPTRREKEYLNNGLNTNVFLHYTNVSSLQVRN